MALLTIYANFLKKLAHAQVKHPYLTVALILAATLAIVGGLPHVKTIASLEQMMPKDIEEIRAFHTLRDQNLGQDMIAIIIETNPESTQEDAIFDVRDRKVLEYIEYLANVITKEPDIRETFSAKDIILATAHEIGITASTIQDIPDDALRTILENEAVKEQLQGFINHDATTTIIIATTDVSADDTRMGILADTIIKHLEDAGHPPGIRTTLTGTPIIQRRLGYLIAKDRKSTQWLSTLLVFIITMILFGTFTSALVPILIVTISVTWLYGIMGYAGLPISTLAGGVAAMVIGIGIDYSIHLMNKFKNERACGKTVQNAIEHAVQETGTALTGAAIATILAFLAFLLGSMPEMRRFGMLMAIGVGSSFTFSIFGLPAFLIIEEKIIHHLKKRLRFGIEGELVLYEKGEAHPDTHEEVKPSPEELKTLFERYKVCKPKQTTRNKQRTSKNN